MATDFDIAVCGAGPVGLTLATLLVQRGMPPGKIVLIDAKSVAHVVRDPRSIALSYGSRQILDEVHAWPTVTEPIHQIHVSRCGHFGRTLIDRNDYHLPALGYVTHYGALVESLAASAERISIPALRPAQVSSIVEHQDHVTLQCGEGTTLTARIAVQAEGSIFSEQSTRKTGRDYVQRAIVAHVRTSAPLPHRAFERFTEEGPLALLPQEDGYALVWCVRPAHAEKLTALPDDAFLDALAQAFGSRVGRFVFASPRSTYPLALHTHAAFSARTVAIGNAAQMLHPVAGQGLNLGLRDASVLARLLAKEATPVMLDKFSQARKLDRTLTIRLTDTMARVFSSAPNGAFSQTLLGLSLGLIDVFKPAKQMLAEQMMFGQR